MLLCRYFEPLNVLKSNINLAKPLYFSSLQKTIYAKKKKKKVIRK